MSAFTKSGRSDTGKWAESKGRFRPKAAALDIALPYISPVRMTVVVVVRCESLDVATVGIHDVDLLVPVAS